MAIHPIDTFRGGISSDSKKGIPGSYKQGAALSIRRFEDTLTTGQKMKKDSGSTVVDLIMASVVSTYGPTYCFGDTGKIYRRAVDGTWTVQATDADGEISGAAEWHGNIYWATSTKLKSTPSSSPDFSSPTTVSSGLSASSKHCMKPISGYLVIGNGSSISVVSIADVFTLLACPITPDCNITSLDDRDGFIMAGAAKFDNIAESYIFLIDPDRFGDANITWTKRFRLGSKNISGLITNEGAYGFAGSKIYYTDFVTVVPVKKIDSAVMNPYATTISESLCLFGLYGNTYPGIYAWGRSDKDQNQTFTLEYPLSPDAAVISDINYGTFVSAIGAVWTDGSNLFASWKSGAATFGVDIIDTSNKSSGFIETLELYFQPLLKRPIVLEKTKIIMKALPSGCSVGLKYKVDKGSWVTAYAFDRTSTTCSTTGETEAWFALQAQSNICYELRLELVASGNYAPEIIRIETYITNPPQ